MPEYTVDLYVRVPIKWIEAQRPAEAIDNATLILNDLLRDTKGVEIADIQGVRVWQTSDKGEPE